MDRLTAFWNRGWIGKVTLTLVGLVVVCCVLGAITRRGAPASSTAAVPTSAPVNSAAANTSAPTVVVHVVSDAPTDAPVVADTPAPEPTAEPVPTDAPVAPAVAKVGDRVEANGIAFTVVSMKKADKIGDFLKADAGNTYVIVEVLIENIDVDKAPYNPFYFKVKDADGFEYTAGITTDNQALKSGNLAKGEKARGVVAVEVKKDATGLVLEYKPLVLFSGDEAIKVALE
jgi:hypothetical protein